MTMRMIDVTLTGFQSQVSAGLLSEPALVAEEEFDGTQTRTKWFLIAFDLPNQVIYRVTASRTGVTRYWLDLNAAVKVLCEACNGMPASIRLIRSADDLLLGAS